MSRGWVIAGCLAVVSVTCAPPLFGETQSGDNSDISPSNVQETERHNNNHLEVISEALVEELRSKWRTEAMAGTSNSQLSEDHRKLLVDATSRANWTPLCSYTEEAIGPDQEEPQIRHHTFEFTEDTLERLLQRREESDEELDGDAEVGDSIGSESSFNIFRGFDVFRGLRFVLRGAKVVNATNATVTYEIPMPFDSMVLDDDAQDGMVLDDDAPDGMASKFQKKLIENMRLHLTIDAHRRGPKELMLGVPKPLRLFPGVKLTEMKYTTNFRYLDDVQEFAVDRSASALSLRAFLVTRFSERESKTMTDFRCVKKG